MPGEPLDTRPLPEFEEIVADVSTAQVPWMASLGGMAIPTVVFSREKFIKVFFSKNQL